MNSTTLLIYTLLVSMLLLIQAPAGESTFLLLACLYRLNICPFRTTTTTAAPTTTS
ncbi:uncharacterized protein LOC115767416 [Drosophila novamexicana]|uniref:uncharacterized protein LOC115767416 n=1 Tax=Drosophila novamexicana TaxID=47314 RepID=UPI0011E59D9C|nr:uncharacterized protein LOC115767416 [Drosophila novamexicana]